MQIVRQRVLERGHVERRPIGRPHELRRTHRLQVVLGAEQDLVERQSDLATPDLYAELDLDLPPEGLELVGLIGPHARLDVDLILGLGAGALQLARIPRCSGDVPRNLAITPPPLSRRPGFDLRRSDGCRCHRFGLGVRWFGRLADTPCRRGVHRLRISRRLADHVVTEFGATSAPYEIEWATRIGNTDADHPDIPMLGFSGDRLYRPMTPSGGSKWGDFLTTIAFIDVAGRGKDELGLGIGSSLGGRVYIHRVDGYIDGIAYETLASIARTLRDHRVRECFVETNFGGEMFPTIFGPVLREHFLRPGESDEHPNDDGAGWACAITPTRATGRKEERIIDTLEPVMASHRLVVHPRALDPDHPADAGQGTEYTLQHQLTRLTRVKGCLRHDDRIDTLAGIVGKFQDYLHIDTRSATEKLRERELEDAMAEMRTMGQRREANWMPHRR